MTVPDYWCEMDGSLRTAVPGISRTDRYENIFFFIFRYSPSSEIKTFFFGNSSIAPIQMHPLLREQWRWWFRLRRYSCGIRSQLFTILCHSTLSKKVSNRCKKAIYLSLLWISNIWLEFILNVQLFKSITVFKCLQLNSIQFFSMIHFVARISY